MNRSIAKLLLTSLGALAVALACGPGKPPAQTENNGPHSDPAPECSVRHVDTIEGFVQRGCRFVRADDGHSTEIAGEPPMLEVVGSTTCVESEDEARRIADEFIAAHPPADDTYTGYRFASLRPDGPTYRVRYDKVFRHGVKVDPHFCEVVVEPDGAVHWEIGR